jgi:arabinose-5-phosphate isomerase
MGDWTNEQILAKAREVIEREAAAVASAAGQLDDTLADVATTMLECQGHVLIAGTGTSHAIARRMAHLLACCGTPALCIDAADSLHGGAGAITSRDVVFIISKGGRSDEINQFARMAQQRGARTIALTEKPDSPLGNMVDLVYRIEAPGDVDPYGMIATGSSLVNAAACDALCVLLLEMRGYTQEQFGATHPGGAVGKKLAGEET